MDSPTRFRARGWCRNTPSAARAQQQPVTSNAHRRGLCRSAFSPAYRPTRWLAVMARHRSLDRHTVLAMENATDLLRMPGMRRSKFLLPHTLAGTVLGATRLPLAHHAWRLRDVGLGLGLGLGPGDYRRMLPELVACAKGAFVRLQGMGSAPGWPGPQARACTSVAAHAGALICVPAENPCSHRWLYSAAPEDGRAPPRARHQRRRHALHFLALHMHATAAGELLMLRSFSFPLAAPAARKPPVRDPRCPCCPSRRPAHV